MAAFGKLHSNFKFREAKNKPFGAYCHWCAVQGHQCQSSGEIRTKMRGAGSMCNTGARMVLCHFFDSSDAIGCAPTLG